MTNTAPVSVPAEPTRKMVFVAETASGLEPDMVRKVWSAMLAAAPIPESGEDAPISGLFDAIAHGRDFTPDGLAAGDDRHTSIEPAHRSSPALNPTA